MTSMSFSAASRRPKNKRSAEFKKGGIVSRYLVLGARPWSIEGFDTLMKLEGSWKLISDPKDLSFDGVATFDPDLVFVLHWSELIPAEIVRRWELVGFHMTDLPYGRGGSPLQNLIKQGPHRHRRECLSDD